MIQKIKYGNSVVRYNLIKSSRRKTSQITVTADGITIRVPQTKSALDIKNMIQEKLPWIFKKQLFFADKKRFVFSTKSALLVLGKRYQIHIIPNSTGKTRLVRNTIEFHILQKNYKTDEIKTQYCTYLEKRAGVLFPKLTREMSQQVGITPTKINVKHLRDRWGSSTQTGEINLNINLMKAPKDVIRYIILHELCHFKIKEHSYHFWNLILQHMPEYKKLEEWLEFNDLR